MAKFKKGDRVKIVELGFVHQSLGIAAGSLGTVEEDGSMHPYVTFDGRDGLVAVAETRLEILLPVAEATDKPSFTIETGKFYRTRDGRKVGPIDHNGFGVYGSPEHPNHWYENGLSFSSNEQLPTDLIAEWVDEPLATASADAASNDNAPVAKFKVGDIVKRSGGFMPHHRLRITKAVGDRYSVEWLEGGPGSIDDWRGYELELVGPPSKPAIVALIEDGQPKPSDAPRVHKSQESATDEAERLAVKYPGQKFGVFVLVDSLIADVVIRRAA